MCSKKSEAILVTAFFQFFVFFFMFNFYPVGNAIFLAHIWILHIILDRIAPNLESFKKFCLKSKYLNRVDISWSNCFYLWICHTGFVSVFSCKGSSTKWSTVEHEHALTLLIKYNNFLQLTKPGWWAFWNFLMIRLSDLNNFFGVIIKCIIFQTQ